MREFITHYDVRVTVTNENMAETLLAHVALSHLGQVQSFIAFALNAFPSGTEIRIVEREERMENASGV